MLFLAPSAYRWGGVQTWLDQTVGSLRGRGWEVRIALVQGPKFHDARAYAREHPALGAVAVPCMTCTAEGRARAVSQLLRREQPDVLVLVNVGDGLEGLRRWKATREGRDCRLVYTLHALAATQFSELSTHGRFIDRVVTTNRLAQRAVLEICGLDAARVGYAPYGADAPTAFCQKGDGGVPLRLAWVGRFEEPQKRVSDLAAVLFRCAELGIAFRCDVAGDGERGDHLRGLLKPLVESGEVRMHGRISREELYATVYPGLDALLLTSSWETGPIVAWEAMRHGAALVSTRYVGLEDEGALRDQENCLLSPIGDVEGLARCVAHLEADPSMRQRLGAAGQALVEQRYSLDASGDAWDRELRSAIATPASEAAPPLSSPGRGRLERWFGAAGAETVRRLSGRKGEAAGPGDEWPHALPGAKGLGDFESKLRLMTRESNVGRDREA